jgi:membrane protein DedA with SNARE-associated domain
MEHLANQLIAYMTTVPEVAIYLIAAGWMVLEGVGIGVPIEPMMLFVGSLAALHHANLPVGILAMSVGCLAGTTVAYSIGRTLGTRAVTRFGRFVGLTESRVEHIDVWLRHRGALGVFLLRLAPMVRTLCPYVEGEAGIKPHTFLVGTLAGAAVYNTIWAILGFLLGHNYRVALRSADDLGPWGIVLVVVLIVLILIAHRVSTMLWWRRLEAHFHLRRASAQAASQAAPAISATSAAAPTARSEPRG